MSATGAEIVAEARRWVGTPWLHQACLRGVGCDCIGLVAGVARAMGMPEAEAWLADARFRGYGRTPKVADLFAACSIYLDRIAPSQLGLGDIGLFAIAREPMHFGIISGLAPIYLIHGYTGAGRVVENALAGKWTRRLVGAYRYRGKA